MDPSSFQKAADRSLTLYQGLAEVEAANRFSPSDSSGSRLAIKRVALSSARHRRIAAVAMFTALMSPFLLANAARVRSVWTNPGAGNWIDAGNRASGAPTGTTPLTTVRNGGTAQITSAANGGPVRSTGVNSYTGLTTVENRTLVVDGSAANSAVTMESDTIIRKMGPMGALMAQSSATVAPSVVTPFTSLNVAGNASFAAGSAFLVNVNPPGQNDKPLVGGTATLSGGTVEVMAGSRADTPTPGFTPKEHLIIVFGTLLGIVLMVLLDGTVLTWGITTLTERTRGLKTPRS
jgi:hypothetical protein